ncbi:MAG: DUF262 domain-containing protein, partial [Deltaproteobacteria bacterium]|nr:DUF262 domain-containing protein [Deltaproteobacteria bacterium]
QRPYSWKPENVDQLLQDMWDAHQAEDKEYFIGSLITIEKDRDRRYEVVDGQQRLATLNLVFARMRDHITDAAAKEELGKRILPRNVLTGEAEAPRLLLRQKDRSFFRRHVIDGEPVPENDRKNLDVPKQRIVENLEIIDGFFRAKAELALKLFANYILNNVYVVFVNTDSWQSAYRLFNVLNARGLSLSNADLIKNALFSLLATEIERSSELEERWLELEEELGMDRLDTFFGHYRTSLTAEKARGSLHEELDPLIRETKGGPFAFLERVLRSARNYVRIVDGDFVAPAASRSLRTLKRVEYDEWIPPLVAFLGDPVEGLPESEFLALLEKITIQNWVRRLGRTARLTVYFQLIKAVRDRKGAEEIREIFRRNANNSEFLDLLGGEVYGF